MDRFMRRLIDPKVNPIFGSVTGEAKGREDSWDFIRSWERRGQEVAENLTSVLSLRI